MYCCPTAASLTHYQKAEVLRVKNIDSQLGKRCLLYLDSRTLLQMSTVQPPGPSTSFEASSILLKVLFAT